MHASGPILAQEKVQSARASAVRGKYNPQPWQRSSVELCIWLLRYSVRISAERRIESRNLIHKGLVKVKDESVKPRDE